MKKSPHLQPGSPFLFVDPPSKVQDFCVCSCFKQTHLKTTLDDDDDDDDDDDANLLQPCFVYKLYILCNCICFVYIHISLWIYVDSITCGQASFIQVPTAGRTSSWGTSSAMSSSSMAPRWSDGWMMLNDVGI